MIEPDSSHTSPDGRIRIEYRSEEMRMSHWVHAPSVTDLARRRVLLRPGGGWSGHHTWLEDERFTLRIAKYPDAAHSLMLTFDPAAGTVQLNDGPPEPIERATRLAEDEFTRLRREEQAQLAALPPEPPSAQETLQRWSGRLAYGLIALVFAALLVMAYLDIQNG